jgi:hypothetical protein
VPNRHHSTEIYLAACCNQLYLFSDKEVRKVKSTVRQKHNCLVILFVAAIATTCFGRAWPSSGHNVDVYK